MIIKFHQDKIDIFTASESEKPIATWIQNNIFSTCDKYCDVLFIGLINSWLNGNTPIFERFDINDPDKEIKMQNYAISLYKLRAFL